jgi:hypothetical protein
MATSYPKLGSSAWFKLRERAASAPSTRFTPETVAAMLGMANPASAAGNTVGPMRRFGLVNEEGSLTERGQKWRSDTTYAEACQEILDEVYPPELGSFTGADGAPDRVQVTTWFQHRGFGNSNARQMSTTYLMIAEKKIPTAPTANSGSKRAISGSKKVGKNSPSKKNPGTAEGISRQADPGPPSYEPAPVRSLNQPVVHLDIQIHIAADASPEQIDQIFASMAKHLYQHE